MRVRDVFLSGILLVSTSLSVHAQNWSFDARTIGLGGVGGNDNLATKMIDEQRPYTSIVLPFGLIQVFKDFDIFDPNSKKFDPIRSVEFAASPFHYVIGRTDSNSAETLFVNDIRNATLSRDLSRYKGFVPANDLLAEGLAAPNFGGTIKIQKGAKGSFQGIYVGAGPYLSMHADGTISPGLTGVLTTGVNVPNARFPIANSDEGQVALAVTGGYRGRFAWPSGIGSGSDREGLYVAANYNYLKGFRYESIDMNIQLDTDASGLITLKPSTTPVVITQREATSGSGFALDLGVGIVIDRWEFGVGANGISNRITWQGLQQTRYSLNSLTSGNSDFIEGAKVSLGDKEVTLPVDYRANVAYTTMAWSAAADFGNGFGGRSFHGGLERRLGSFELRAGARYTSTKWNPSGGLGFDLTPRVSLDVAAYGTNANIERKRQTAIAASIRFNRTR